jgi:hypothetical protein
MAEAINTNTHNPNGHFESQKGQRRKVLTSKECIAYALANLAFPYTDVEASEDQFGIFIQAALDEYNNWRPIEKMDVLDAVTSALNKYDLNDMGKPYGRGISDVRIGTKENFFSPISGVFALGIPHPISHLSPDQYDLALRYIKTARKVYSSSPHWEWQEPVLWLYAPTGYGGPFVAGYTYWCDAMGPEEVRQADYKWFKDYFYNLVKRAVGEARDKFTGIPGPQAMALDGARMIQEANQAMEKLSAVLESKSYAESPPLGPGQEF